jgi:hypothetical protein
MMILCDRMRVRVAEEGRPGKGVHGEGKGE